MVKVKDPSEKPGASGWVGLTGHFSKSLAGYNMLSKYPFFKKA
jgi:hypothetical protein